MEKNIRIFLSKHWFITIFLIFYFACLTYKIIAHPTPFYDWDESLYVESGKEMFEHKFFLFPVWQGEAWLDKPPLIPFLYGFIMKLFFFIPPEISTRLFTVSVATVILSFVYTLYLKASKSSFIATLATAITAFTPIFLQRNQIVNLDIYVLLGWLGYILFFQNFWVSLVFLAISVFTKSLIGFYPTVIMFSYYAFLLFTKRITLKDFQKNTTKIGIHVFILSLWFILMFLVYGNVFWQQHIIESHFRRVTSSIEFHFGEKTFYIDLAYQQLGIFFWFALGGLGLYCFQIFTTFRRKDFNAKEILHGLYLLPWYLFLNLTKTKIFWYFYSAIPQFGYLASYPLTLFKKNKKVFYSLGMILFTFTLYQAFITNNFFGTFYSKNEPYLDLANYAKTRCSSLVYLQNPSTRKSFEELNNLGLLITTTKWWGSHPSIVYYFGRKVNLVYSTQDFVNTIKNSKQNECFMVEDADISLTKDLKLLKKFDQFYLFKS